MTPLPAVVGAFRRLLYDALMNLDNLPYISSLQNPQVKRLVRLRGRKEREQADLLLLEGGRESLRGLQSGLQLAEMYLCPELFSADAQALADSLVNTNSYNLTLLSRTAFEKVSLRENPDGILCICQSPKPKLPELNNAPNALVIVLHDLEKPGNVGAILRTADAVGAVAVLVLGRGADPYGPNVIRASQGSVFHVPTISLEEDAALAWLNKQQFNTIACTPDAPQDYWDAPLTGRVALLLGSEHSGLPTSWRQTDKAVSIPMQGAADSLNVATAAALVMYEALRQQRTTIK